MKYFIYILFAFSSIGVLGQVPNDECQFATHLGNVADYCSGESEFSNEGATLSPQAIPFCWFGGSQNDVWYTFTPTAPGVYVQIVGSILSRPSIVVYEGGCNSLVELGCSSANAGNVAELSITQLVIGQTYWLRVDAENLNIGSFQLCLSSFLPIPKPESDCKDAVVLCDKSPFQVENLNSVGDVLNELTGPCVDVGVGQNEEQASVFYKWTCDQSGTLTFILNPNNPNSTEEDLDFVVYELPGGLDDCDGRIGVRCMLSGRSGQLTAAQNAKCTGPTGLAVGETDVSETAGCQGNSNNFVAPLDMVSGVSYALIINNFSKSGFGFSIEFGGTGTFLGPNADFEIEAQQAFECDKTVDFTNLSSTDTDPIVSYSWNFGVGSKPSTAIGPGPHSTLFESFGDKVASLTIESSRGCLVTQIVEFYVDPCCKDTSNLLVTGVATDVLCAGDDDGLVIANGQAGDPEYQYSLNGGSYQLSPQFGNLKPGTYELRIIDEKGCENNTTLIILEPDPTIANAGPDISVDLGYSGVVDASGSSDVNVDIVDISWSPLDSFLTCTKCYDPEILPPGNTTYTLTVTDENGCTATDQVQFLVNIVRPIFTPNIFSPNDDGTNDFFNIFGGPAVDYVESLKVFDRWGNMVYNGSPDINDPTQGWDGFYKNRHVENGVYGWLAQVRFIDNETIAFSGDVTVMRYY
ncbi:MAG: gliding motility-associated C-terminal domain-containing protein [Saprospiraceae bacterium]